MKRRFIKLLIDIIAGRIYFQRLFEFLHSISVYGMNYGNGGDFRISGELFASSYVRTKLLNKYASVIIFDVGANIGYFSSQLSSIFENCDYKIHAFEPSKKTYSEYIKNTETIKSVIIAQNIALGDVENKILLYTNTDSSGLASIYQRQLEYLDIQMDKFEEIKVSTIDSYVAQNSIDRIHFLKLDIEGHELKALEGAKNMIALKKIDFIQFEFGGCNIDSKTYFQNFWYLLKDYYHFYRIVRNGLQPITEYHENREIFKPINYLLELK